MGFYSDVSKAKQLGMGCVLGNRWIYAKWPVNFIQDYDPSIEYLKLFTLVAGVLTWENQLANIRFIVHCDNQMVVHMVNKLTSSCGHCMRLLRLLVLNGLQFNHHITVKYVNTKDNEATDSLSRLDVAHFHRVAPQMRQKPDMINDRIWPITRIW